MSAIKRLLTICLLAGSLAGGLAACAPVFRNHGYVPPEFELNQVQVGQTTIDELPGLIGRPSAQGLLTGSGWYYVGSRWRDFGAAPPREVDRQVVAVSFAPNGTVSNVERFGLERGRVVTLSRRVTEGGTPDISFIGQLLRNVGNFQAGDFID